jgi:hypothetical protein
MPAPFPGFSLDLEKVVSSETEICCLLGLAYLQTVLKLIGLHEGMAANILNDDRMLTELCSLTYSVSKSFQVLLGKYPPQYFCYSSFNIGCICFREEDLTELEKTGSLYQAGLDKQGRPVIVFIGEFYLLISMFFSTVFLFLW